MNITIDDVVTWLIVGAIAGSISGMLVTRRKEGFGRVLNLVVGLVGALIGGLLFKLLVSCLPLPVHRLRRPEW